LTVAIGCTGGQHRSVFIAEALARYFDGSRDFVMVRHRELNEKSSRAIDERPVNNGVLGVLKREITIINKLGLHARAAAKFVTLAAGFDAEIRLLRGAREVNGKSIMGVMMLAAGCGDQLELHASGPEAEQALDNLRKSSSPPLRRGRMRGRLHAVFVAWHRGFPRVCDW
jgi:phosphocarrier protein HPr